MNGQQKLQLDFIACCLEQRTKHDELNKNVIGLFIEVSNIFYSSLNSHQMVLSEFFCRILYTYFKGNDFADY